MAKFRVEVSTRAWVKGVVTVEATSKKEVQKKAIDPEMIDVVWEYDGIDENFEITAGYTEQSAR